MKYLFAFVLFHLTNIAFADEPRTSDGTVTILQSKTSGMGQDDLNSMNDITTMFKSKDIDGALQKIGPMLVRCDSSQANSDKSIVYFEDASEFLEYSIEYSIAPDKKKDLVWMKDICPSAYKTAAFLYVEKDDTENALKYLDKAIERAPFGADPFTERGFIFASLKNFESAKAAYEKAVELSSSHKSSAYVTIGVARTRHCID